MILLKHEGWLIKSFVETRRYKNSTRVTGKEVFVLVPIQLTVTRDHPSFQSRRRRQRVNGTSGVTRRGPEVVVVGTLRNVPCPPGL